MTAKTCLGKVLNQELRQGQDFVTGLFSWPAFQAIFCGPTTPFRPSLTTTPSRSVAPSDALQEGLGVSFQPSKHQSSVEMLTNSTTGMYLNLTLMQVNHLPLAGC